MLLTRSEGRRPGKVVVLVAVCLVAIVGVTAIAVDGGVLQDERRRAQAVADAAALAAACELFENSPKSQGFDPSNSAKATALTVAAAHGYTNDGTNSVVTVNIPPESGTFQGRRGYAEVIVTYYVQRSFSAIFGSGPLPVRARAVARGTSDPSHMGLILLDPNKFDAFQHSGNGINRVIGGSIIVNSKVNIAYQQSGQGTMSAASHEVTGNYQQSGSGQIIGPMHTNVPPTPDPLRFIPAPNPADYPVRSTQKVSIGNQTVVLEPGVYKGGIDFSGKGNVTLNPGIYIMDGGGFKVQGDGVLTGHGVMIYNKVRSDGDHGQVLMSGNGAVTLSPPTTGIYKGIGVFQQRSQIDVVQISGNGKFQITGVLYAASAHVQLSGNGVSSVDALGSSVVANTLQISGNGSFDVDVGSNQPVVRDIRLVE